MEKSNDIGLTDELVRFVQEGTPLSGPSVEILEGMSEEKYIGVLASTEDAVSKLEPSEGVQNRRTWLITLVTNRALLDSIQEVVYEHGGHHLGMYNEKNGRRHSRGSLSKYLSSTDA